MNNRNLWLFLYPALGALLRFQQFSRVRSYTIFSGTNVIQSAFTPLVQNSGGENDWPIRVVSGSVLGVVGYEIAEAIMKARKEAANV